MVLDGQEVPVKYMSGEWATPSISLFWLCKSGTANELVTRSLGMVIPLLQLKDQIDSLGR